MRNTITTLIIILSLNLFGLVRSKAYVQNLNVDIKKMQVEEDQLNAEVRVLNAEWAYLNRIERLDSLSQQYLGLKKVSSKQVRSVSKNVVNLKKLHSVNFDARNMKAKTEWRYKPRVLISKAMTKNNEK